MFGPAMTATLDRNGHKMELELCPPKDEKAVAEAFTTYLNDRRVTVYTDTLQRCGFCVSGEETWLRDTASDQNAVTWIIYADKMPVGSIGITSLDRANRSAEIGIVIGEKSHWGKGIASAVEAMVVEYCMNNIVAGGLNKVHARVLSENTASMKALKRVGFSEVGIRREDIWTDGRWHDVWLCELLQSDWNAICEERFADIGLVKFNLYPGCEDCGYPPIV